MTYLHQDKELQKMGTAAHKLKGSALNVGAALLADTCKQIEIKGRAGENKDLEVLIEALKRVFDETAVELKKLSAN